MDPFKKSDVQELGPGCGKDVLGVLALVVSNVVSLCALANWLVS